MLVMMMMMMMMVGYPPVSVEFPLQRANWSFHVFFDVSQAFEQTVELLLIWDTLVFSCEADVVVYILPQLDGTYFPIKYIRIHDIMVD